MNFTGIVAKEKVRRTFEYLGFSVLGFVALFFSARLLLGKVYGILYVYETRLTTIPKGNFSNFNNTLAIDLGASLGFFDGACTELTN